MRTPQRRPWRPVSVEWSGWFVVFWASWDPSHHPPSPGLLCLSPAWCPTPHRHFSLQKESFFCIISTSLNWLHPFGQWQSVDKYIFVLPYSGRFTHRKCIIKGDTCVFDTLLSIYYKRKRPHVRLDLQKSMALALGEHSEICTFVTEMDNASHVIYCTQLCLIYTKSISDKNTTSSATWKRQHEYMREMHLPWHGKKSQIFSSISDLKLMTTFIWIARFLLSAAGYYSFG